METKEKTKKSELQIIPADLNTAIETTKIERSKAEQHAMAFAPSMNEYLTYAEVIKGLNRDNPTDTDAKKAREARLRLVKVRTGAEEIKDVRKEGIRAEGDLIQALFNVVKNSCLVTETEFTEIEKHQERLEEKREAELTRTRGELLFPYGTDTTYLSLGKLTDEQFDRLLDNEKLAFTARKEAAEKAEQARIDAERIAEEQRIEAARKDAEEREAQRLENERLKAENEAKEALLAKEREAADKLAKENEAKLAEQARLAKVEADKQAAELAKQKEAADKLVEALRIQQLADEEKQRQEAKQRAEQLAAEKAALVAPDKEKVRALFEAIKALIGAIPEFSSADGKEIGKAATDQLKALQSDIIEKSKKLV